MKTSPTQRSLALLRKLGYTCAITEHWNQYAFIRQDLYGFIDLLAMKEGEPLLAIQTTSTANNLARIKKILALPQAKLWLQIGNKLQVIGWSKKGARGKVKHWIETIKEIDISDFKE